MPQEDAVFPSLVEARFPLAARRDAARLLARGRVEAATFFRLGIAGRVVAPNGRGVPALLAVDRKGALLAATCGCTPKLLPDQLCMHLGALVLSLSRPARPGGPPALPGERFERSVWFRAAEELHDQRGTVASGYGVGAGDASDLAGLPDLAPFEPYEKRLVDVTRTPDEALLNQRGAKTQRQSFEASNVFLLAKRAFEAVGDDPSRVDVEVANRALRLVTRHGPPFYHLPLTVGAIEVLLREAPTFFAERGIALGGVARESLRLTLERNGSLLLSPVYLVGDGTSPTVLSREESAAGRCGRYLVFPETRTLVPLAESRRPFVERSASAQTGFEFDDIWRSSSLGVPLDRATRVPPAEVAPFLSRHRAEVAAFPATLLPKELRGGGLVEPDGAVLTVEGEAKGRFLLSLDYLIDESPIPFGPIVNSRKSRSPLHLVAGRALDPRDGRFGWMDLLDEVSLVGKGASARLSLAPLEVCRLRSYLPVGHRLQGAPGVSASALDLLESLSPDAPPPPPEEAGLTLYDFQRTGYAWLWFLHRGGFGGLLCDDMGLGKTHQVMALLAAMTAETRGREGVRPEGSILIVAPASVLPHWEEKLRRYLPALVVVRHQGGARGALPAGGGLVLTSYGTLRNDAASFQKLSFDLFVLDEIQAIKNRDTETHRALRSIPARMAIGLTGTPIENRVEELHTLLDFVLPGYLPPPAAFRQSFAKPIEEGDERSRERLRRLVRPFVLRRTKAQVAIGLPEKIEDRRLCEMTPGQAKIYDNVLTGQGASLVRSLDGTGQVSTLHVFALLGKLKQICDHPDLVLPPGAAPSGQTSGKWELFVEILDEALGSGLKVVVFSQYLRMLDRIEVHLGEIGAGWAGLRGATVDRAAPVERFHTDSACRVFVASLKAAGLGIDLTPASVVIHYDRWWNKAREDQATDRVHRIGQKRGVQVLTLVTRGTVEERIDRLIAQKARLAADLVPEEDPRIFRRFTREELRELLAP